MKQKKISYVSSDKKMNSLLLLDNLGGLLVSKNPAVQEGLRAYIRYIQKIAQHLVSNIELGVHDQFYIAGPREILAGFAPSQKVRIVFYDQVIDEIDWKKAGEISSNLADRVDASSTLRELCPEWFPPGASLPRIVFVRLAHLFCYDAVSHKLLIEQLCQNLKIEKMMVLGGLTEMEKVASGVAKQNHISFQACFPDDFLIRTKSFFDEYVYDRDRRLHAQEELRRENRTPPSKATKNYIAFVPAHSLHFKTLIPLAKKINQTGQFNSIVFLSHSVAEFRRVLEKENISYSTLDHFSSADEDNHFTKYRHSLDRAFEQLSKSERFRNDLTWDGIEWLDVMEKKVKSFFKWSFGETLMLKERFKKAFHEIGPKSVFVFSDARLYESAAAASAREIGIPVFFYSPNPMMALDEINRYNTGDDLLVGGCRMKQLIIEKQWMKPEHIFEVGDIRFDDLSEWKTNARMNGLKAEYGYQPEDKIFLLVSWYTNLKFTIEEKKIFFLGVRDAFRKNPQMKLVIKAHPNENEELLQNFVNSLGFDAPVLKNVPLYDLLAISSGIITTASMTSLEAMMFDVPVLSMDLPGRDYDYYIPLKKGGGAIPFKDSEALSQILNRLTSDMSFEQEQRRKGRIFVKQYIHYPESARDLAGEKILEILINISRKSKEKKTIAVIQARMSSERLPKKVLLKIGGETVLEHVIRRTQKAKRVDGVVVATSAQKEDDLIENECSRLGVACYRGSLENVLERYVKSAEKYNADIVVRITADSPLVEPAWIDQAVHELIARDRDYVNAKLPEEFPTGMGCEVIAYRALLKSLENAKIEQDFEHVTWYCLSHRDQFKIHFLTNFTKWHPKELRLSLDESADYELINTIWNELSHEKFIDYQTIGRLYQRKPHLFELNKHIQEKPNLYTREIVHE